MDGVTFFRYLCSCGGVFLATLSIPGVHAEEIAFSLQGPGGEVQAGEVFSATLETKIEAGWHLYSMTQPPGGPIPTTMTLGKGPIFSLAGEIQQSPVTSWFDQNFGIVTEYFEGDVRFTLPVRAEPAAQPGAHPLKVRVRFMLCSDTVCLPPRTQTVSTAVQVTSAPGPALAASSPPARAQQSGIGRPETPPLSSEVVPPAADSAPEREIPSGPVAFSDSGVAQEGTDRARPLPIATLPYLWLAMGMGGLALLTPCVFPMIPITVSYFTKRESISKKQAVGEAALYSVGIILTFTLIGFGMTLLLGAGGISRLASSPLVNVVIATVFVVFALSLFGVFEIRLPSKWLNAIDRKSSRASGVLGILLMGLTFSLTSFTCTVPFVGTVMVAAVQGDWLWSLMGVGAFALVFSSPFFLLALFPSWLQSLPKSGDWMNSVKITMGFLELAAALKFVSNVDLVYQWELLTRPVFLTVWLAIAILLTLYLLGKFHFQHEAPQTAVGAVRVLFSTLFLAVSFYLLRGLFGFPLGELDAFLPPRDYGNGAVFSLASSGKKEGVWLTNYQAALGRAREESQPVFINFTGFTCTNCRWMEANIFPLPEVRRLLEEYVLVRLYTDGNQPEHRENLRFERERFGTIALPLYALMSPQDEIIATFPGLTRDKNEFVRFLREGSRGGREFIPAGAR